MSNDLDALVDLDRYPIDQLHTLAGRQLVERCRVLLQHPGACELAGFLRDDAVTRAPDPSRSLHAHPGVVAFVAATLDVADLIPSTDPMGAIDIMYYGPGDELGWHFDRSDFVVTLMLQHSTAGGHFEFAP